MKHMETIHPLVKLALTVLSAALTAAPMVPQLAAWANLLQPIGGVIAGWLHMPQPVTTKKDSAS